MAVRLRFSWETPLYIYVGVRMLPKRGLTLPILFAKSPQDERDNQPLIVAARGIESLAVNRELIARVGLHGLSSFLTRVLRIRRIVSLCGKVKNKSQVHAFTSFLSSWSAGCGSLRCCSFPGIPYGFAERLGDLPFSRNPPLSRLAPSTTLPARWAQLPQ